MSLSQASVAFIASTSQHTRQCNLSFVVWKSLQAKEIQFFVCENNKHMPEAMPHGQLHKHGPVLNMTTRVLDGLYFTEGGSTHKMKKNKISKKMYVRLLITFISMWILFR